MAGEIVKYKNELNKFSFSGITETEINFVYAIFQQFKEKDKTEITFKLDEIQNLMGFNRKDVSFSSYALLTLEKLQDFKIRCRNPLNKEEILSVIVFPVVGVNPVERKIRIKISQEIANYLNQIENNFTRFELAEFVNLSGSYAKNLYKLLKQYRSTGWAKFEWNEFKMIMDIPNNYRASNIDQKVLKVAIKELTKPRTILDCNRKPFTNLKYEKIKGAGKGRGGKVVGIKFTFDPQVDEPDEPEETLTLEALVGAKPQRVGDAIK